MGDASGEHFALKDQGANDIGGYDFLKDVERVETFVDAAPGWDGFAVMITNLATYWNPAVHARETNADGFRRHEPRMRAWPKDAGSHPATPQAGVDEPAPACPRVAEVPGSVDRRPLSNIGDDHPRLRLRVDLRELEVDLKDNTNEPLSRLRLQAFVGAMNDFTLVHAPRKCIPIGGDGLQHQFFGVATAAARLTLESRVTCSHLCDEDSSTY